MTKIEKLEIAVEKAKSNCVNAVRSANNMAEIPLKSERQIKMSNDLDRKAAEMTKKFEQAISDLESAKSENA